MTTPRSDAPELWRNRPSCAACGGKLRWDPTPSGPVIEGQLHPVLWPRDVAIRCAWCMQVFCLACSQEHFNSEARAQLVRSLKGAEDVRLFVAYLPPRAVAAHLENATKGVRRLVPEARWPGRQRLHLNLLYIGGTPAKRVPEILEAIDRVVAGTEPFALDMEKLAVFSLHPGEGPRVLGIDLGPSEGAVREFHDLIVRSVAAVQPVKERIRFQPHIALAKTYDPDEKLRAASRALSQRAGLAKMPDLKVRQVVVFRSDRERAGEPRKFTSLGRYALGAGET